ncbi:TetR/AcrR family transcriptional regulator [Mastigocladopsis repens]|uniref:TetR/AcrR family transcriptional regulator n=1 Tax=Mastigocladopsis repens TaxID=221287 RepID=UPI0002FE3077|nr:TetR/AcrR family transcriptional regulator [Mastigocladopsis repens]
MARIPKITNQQILEAAREVFLEKGFSGSTLEIAARAGISEASIFKRFSTKEELFFAAMGIPETPVWVTELEPLVGKGNLKENLIQICIQILEFHQEVMPRFMMLRSRGKALPKPESLLESKPIRDVKALTSFLEHEMKQGRLCPCDSKTLALLLIGSLMNYVFFSERMGAQASVANTDQEFVQRLVEILWQGIAPVLD